MADIFVSYASSDREWAHWLEAELAALGHAPDLHEWETGAGDAIYAWMERRHDAGAHLLCVVSDDYLKTPYSTLERSAALWQAARAGPGFVILVVVEACQLPTPADHLRLCKLFGLSRDAARERLRDFMADRVAEATEFGEARSIEKQRRRQDAARTAADGRREAESARLAAEERRREAAARDVAEQRYQAEAARLAEELGRQAEAVRSNGEQQRRETAEVHRELDALRAAADKQPQEPRAAEAASGSEDRADAAPDPDGHPAPPGARPAGSPEAGLSIQEMADLYESSLYESRHDVHSFPTRIVPSSGSASPPPPPAGAAPDIDHAHFERPSPSPPSGRRPWLAIGAAILGGIAFVFRHEIAALATSLFAKLSSLDVRGPPLAATMAFPASGPTDLVDVSAFAPNGGAPGETVLVQVFLHLPRQAKTTIGRAREADPDVPRRGCTPLAVEVTRGQHLDVFLEGKDAKIDEPFQSLVWRGQPCACQFLVRLPRYVRGDACPFRVQVMLDRVPIGSLKFSLRLLQPATESKRPARHGDAATRHRHAFLSYASADRAEVLKRAQSLRVAGITFFQDVLTLAPGEEWADRLYEEIDRCDLFLLFWSSHAASSAWVRREVELALARQKRSLHEAPEITPIILEGPPVPEPIPAQLAHLHFNDYLLYAIAGSAPASAPPPPSSIG